MTKRITPTLTLYDSTVARIEAEAARRGITTDDLLSELLTIGAAALPAPGADVPTEGYTAADAPQYYTAADAARILQLKPRTVSDYCRDGRIKAVKVGRGWRITPDALSDYINAHGGKAGAGKSDS